MVAVVVVEEEDAAVGTFDAASYTAVASDNPPGIFWWLLRTSTTIYVLTLRRTSPLTSTRMKPGQLSGAEPSQKGESLIWSHQGVHLHFHKESAKNHFTLKPGIEQD